MYFLMQTAPLLVEPLFVAVFLPAEDLEPEAQAAGRGCRF